MDQGPTIGVAAAVRQRRLDVLDGRCRCGKRTARQDDDELVAPPAKRARRGGEASFQRLADELQAAVSLAQALAVVYLLEAGQVEDADGDGSAPSSTARSTSSRTSCSARRVAQPGQLIASRQLGEGHPLLSRRLPLTAQAGKQERHQGGQRGPEQRVDQKLRALPAVGAIPDQRQQGGEVGHAQTMKARVGELMATPKASQRSRSSRSGSPPARATMSPTSAMAIR